VHPGECSLRRGTGPEPTGRRARGAVTHLEEHRTQGPIAQELGRAATQRGRRGDQGLAKPQDAGVRDELCSIGKRGTPLAGRPGGSVLTMPDPQTDLFYGSSPTPNPSQAALTCSARARAAIVPMPGLGTRPSPISSTVSLSSRASWASSRCADAVRRSAARSAGAAAAHPSSADDRDH